MSNPNKESILKMLMSVHACMVKHESLDSNAIQKYKQKSLVLTSSKKFKIGKAVDGGDGFLSIKSRGG